MKSLERMASVLSLARRRSPMAVMPGHVLSPMDTRRTVSVSRELIDECQRELADSASTLRTDAADPEMRRAAAGGATGSAGADRAG